MRGRIEMGDGIERQHQDRTVEHVQRIPWRVDVKHIRQTDHQPGNRHRQHREEMRDPTPIPEALRLLHEIRTGEDDQRPEDGRNGRHLQRVEVGVPAVGVEVAELIVIETERQVVGPVRDKRRPHRDAQYADDQGPEKPAIRDECEITATHRLRFQRNGTRRQQRHLLALDQTIGGESNHRRDQQHEANHRTHFEVLLPHNLLVGIGRQHVELTTDHFGDAEVRDDQRKHDETGADETVFDARNCNRPEHAPARRTQRIGCLIKPAIGQRQSRDENEHRERKAVKHLRHENADWSVNRCPHHPIAQKSLIAKNINQRDRRKQRWGENRQ